MQLVHLPKDAKERFKRYQYNGTDKSIIYNYFWKPLCVALARQLPDSLAPNVITIVGFLPQIVIYFVFVSDLPQFQVDSPPSSLFWWLTFASIFFYQLADNLDGAQARRINNCSELGCWLDHTTDTIVTVIQSLNIAAAVSTGTGWKLVATFICALTVFHLEILKQFFTGKLVIPQINAANEGLLILMVIYAFNALSPQNVYFWTQEFTFSRAGAAAVAGVEEEKNSIISSLFAFVVDKIVFVISHDSVRLVDIRKFECVKDARHLCIQNNTFAVFLMILPGILTGLSSLYSISWAMCYGREELDLQQEHSYEPFISKVRREKKTKIAAVLWAYAKMMPYFLICVLLICWFLVTPTDVFGEHPRTALWAILGLPFCSFTSHVMLQHLLDLNFYTLSRTVLLFAFVALHLFVIWILDISIDLSFSGTKAALTHEHRVFHALIERFLMLEMFLVNIFFFANELVQTPKAMAEALEISIFRVKEKKEKAL